MSGVNKQSEITQEQARQLAEAFNQSPGMQRLRKLFEKAPPPWSKVRDVSQEGP